MMRVTEEKAYEMYDEMLDEQGTIKIGNLEYYPSYVLEKVDPIAYRVGFSDFLDAYEIEIVDEDEEETKDENF